MKTNAGVWIALLCATLAGCGGAGSGGEGCTPTLANPALCVGGTTATPGATVGSPVLSLSLTNAAGGAVSQLSLERSGTLSAVVRDKNGVAARDVAVTFTSTDKTVVFTPSSGTALTDASGVAKVGLAAGTQAGGFTATAVANVDGIAATGTLGYAVTFPTLNVGALAIAPAILSSGGTASITTTVLNEGNPFTPVQSVTFTSPCAAAGKASIGSPVTTVNGVASTSYVDKGCGGSDTITASTTLAGASSSQTGVVTVLAAAAGQIAFVSALPQNIAMKSTGGPGRQESSQVLFRVTDRNGNPVSGVSVDFSLTTTAGGLYLTASSATSDPNGHVAAHVNAGIVNTPVRVLASIAGGISSLSDQLVISTGIPDQNSFTAVPEVYNIECADHDGTDFTTVTAFVADHFNNPVPDGTAVSFTTEAGAIDASCLTGLKETSLIDGSKILQKGVPGQCTIRFICQNPHVSDGRSTVLAYVLGEESFSDDPTLLQGVTNQYNAGEPFQDLREPFRYDRAITNVQAQSANNGLNNAVTPIVGEPYIDTDGNGHFSAGDSRYNGVLRSTSPEASQTVHVRDAFVLVFSGSRAVLTPLGLPAVTLDHCSNGTPFVNLPRVFDIAVRDSNPTIFPGNALPGNILPAGTRIEFILTNGKLLSEPVFIVPNTNDPSSTTWTYRAVIQSDAIQDPLLLSCTNSVASGLLTVKVTTPLDHVTTQAFTVTD